LTITDNPVIPGGRFVMCTQSNILVRPLSGRSEVGRRTPCRRPILELILTYRVRGAG